MSKGGGAQGGSTVNQQAADPFALASAQTQSNIDTAKAQAQLTNINTFSPYGSSTYQNWGDGYNLNQQLSPALQNLFGTQTSLAQMLAGGAQGMAPGAADISNVGRNLVNQAGGIGGLISPTLNLSNVAPITTLTPGSFRTDVAQGPVQTSVAPGGPIQSSVSTDFPTLVKNAQDAAYQSQTQYLDPQFTQGEKDLRQRLSDQGIQEGTPAYTRALGDFTRQKQQAYQSAQDNAVAAGNEQQRALFGQAITGGQFANQAQQQLFGQGATAMQLGNQAQGQLFGQGMSLANLYNQAVLGATQQQNTAAQLGLQRAQAVQQTPLGTLSALMGAGTGAYGAGVGGATGLGSLAQLWPTGPISIPTMGGTPATVAPTNYAAAAGAAANVAGANRQAGQTGLSNLLAGGNLASQIGFGKGLGELGGSSGLFGGGGLLSSLFGGGGEAAAAGGGLLDFTSAIPFLL